MTKEVLLQGNPPSAAVHLPEDPPTHGAEHIAQQKCLLLVHNLTGDNLSLISPTYDCFSADTHYSADEG